MEALVFIEDHWTPPNDEPNPAEHLHIFLCDHWNIMAEGTVFYPQNQDHAIVVLSLPGPPGTLPLTLTVREE